MKEWECWQDIFDSISQARRLIYITGWSVWHKVRLVRDAAGYASDYTLGDLLRSKSQEGVRVLLLIWDDPTSRSILGYKTVSNTTFSVTYLCISMLDRIWLAIVCICTPLLYVVITNTIFISFWTLLLVVTIFELWQWKELDFGNIEMLFNRQWDTCWASEPQKWGADS